MFRKRSIDRLHKKLYFCAVGSDAVLIPGKAVLFQPLVAAVACFITIHIDDTIAFVHLDSSTRNDINDAPHGIAQQVYAIFNGFAHLFNDPPVTYMTEYNDMVRYHTEKREGQQAAPVVFQWKGYGEDAACNFSFDVHKGECLAVQIMDARGMEELRKILTGDILPESGEILLNGKQTEIPGNGRIAVIQERTTKTMIFPKLDYMNNLCICLAEKVPSIWHNKRLQKSIRNEYSPILGTDVFEMPVEELSEKQKYQLVYTRVFLQKPEILFCIQPFCGADLAHRMFIWSMLEKFLDKGISVVILSLNLSDSLAMADRLLILGENGKKKEIVRENFHKITSSVPWLHRYPSERK